MFMSLSSVQIMIKIKKKNQLKHSIKLNDYTPKYANNNVKGC